MIIDQILDRKDYHVYDARAFYDYCNNYVSNMEWGWRIASALDSGTNRDVQSAICDYLISEYGWAAVGDLCKWVDKQIWITD